jgi:type II secretion system protein D
MNVHLIPNMKPTVVKHCRGCLVLLLACTCALSSGTGWAQQRGAGTGTATRSRSSTSGSYPTSTEAGQATVSYDPETRKLIVVTDDETAQNISQVVSNLDRPAPQVLIKVVFLEVTYTKGIDLGVDGSFQKNMGNNTTGTVGQAFSGLSGLSGIPSTAGGLYSLAGTDYTVTLHALALAGKLEVLSRPSILARNNQQATITVGQSVPLITGTTYTQYGQPINSISYTSVGIILQVTPFITSDGLVEMVVSPQISNLSDQTVNISTGTNAVGAPVINTRSADTVVVTPDGQTVVIGGLMQKLKTETISKIPVLGDIPLLGAAFRRKVSSDAKTELLIFLTPRIVKYPRELAALSAQERANTQIAPKAFPESELNRYLDTLPEKGSVPAQKTGK